MSDTFSPPANSLLVVANPSIYGYTISSITRSFGMHLTHHRVIKRPFDARMFLAVGPQANG